MSRSVIAAFLAISGLALLCAAMAFLNLVHGRNAAFKLLAKGPLAGRELFTPKGWRYRNLALFLQATAILILLLGATM